MRGAGFAGPLHCPPVGGSAAGASGGVHDMKENAAINQLFELLEARYALRVLWALKDGHPQTFRLLQDSVGGITPNTLNTRIKALREAGLMTHGTDGYVVTPTGTDMLKRINDLQAFSARWVLNQTKKKIPA
jgi:DNA-binding HxlR family transcriptional regulator